MTRPGRATRSSLLALGLLAGGCLSAAKQSGPGGPGASADGGVIVGDGGYVEEPTGAAALVPETFPDGLLLPWPGAASTYYDNTFLRYPQLKARVKVIFNDDWVRNGVDEFAARITLFGGVDFVSNTNEARGATPDFLLALDDMAKGVCSQASTAKTGPFASIDPTAIGDAATVNTKINALYEALLFRPASAAEQTAASSLISDLVTGGSVPADAWSGLCEGLVHSQDFLFTLAPAVEQQTGAAKTQLILVRIAQDLVGRPPLASELGELSSGQKTLSNLVDDYLGSTEFRDWYFYRMQIKTQSLGTDAANEPARLWTYLAINDQPFQDLFVGDYSVDTMFNKTTRDPSHGKTGILTMPGFIAGKPGLPHFTYSARVFGDYLGITFEVTPAIIAARTGATPSSTVQPNSLCFTCHQMLTPLAYQRQDWLDDGSYTTTDANGNTIDDSDQNLVPSYPFKGKGIESFSTQAVKKEAFIRKMLDAMYLLTVGREMRAYEDERVIYKQLWDLTASSNGDLKQILKAIILSPAYQGS